MCGWQHVGYIVDGGRVRYTDWGQLSVELALGIRGTRGAKIDLCVRNVLGQLKKAIDDDVKGEISLRDYPQLLSDGNWLIIANHLFAQKRGVWLRH